MSSIDRESLALLRERGAEYAARYDQEALLAAGDDVRSVGALLVEQPRLRRILSNPGVPEDIRVGLFHDLVAEKLTDLGREICDRIVRARWRSPLSMLDAFETVSAATYLTSAAKAGELARVEDELFQFWRALQGSPELAQALDDEAVPVERRAEMMRSLIADEAHPTAMRLVELALNRPGGLTVLPATERLVDLAAEAHRSQIAFVTSAVPLDEEQVRRLTEQLSREQGRPVDVKITVDRRILGGVVVRIGDEIIDGSVSRRLRDARATVARAG